MEETIWKTCYIWEMIHSSLVVMIRFIYIYFNTLTTETSCTSGILQTIKNIEHNINYVTVMRTSNLYSNNCSELLF